MAAVGCFTFDNAFFDNAVFSEDECIDLLSDVFSRRASQPIGGSNPIRFIELFGANEVFISAHEPDPVTARTNYYYNSRQNHLYQKIRTKPKPVWKRI